MEALELAHFHALDVGPGDELLQVQVLQGASVFGVRRRTGQIKQRGNPGATEHFNFWEGSWFM